MDQIQVATRRLVIAHQPACSNVLLIEDDGRITRLYQSTKERCFGYADGVLAMGSRVSGVTEHAVGRGDAIALYREFFL